MAKSKLYLFTDTYPFGHGETFVRGELESLSRHFEITLIPTSVVRFEKSRLGDVLFGGIRLDLTLSKEKSKFINNKLFCLIRIIFTSRLFYSELWKQITGANKVTIEFLTRLIGTISQANIIQKWIADYSNDFAPDVCYTYWFGGYTLGLAQIKKDFPHSFRLVTRAHGYDVHDYLFESRTMPCRRETLKTLDKVFCVSNHGAKIVQGYCGYFTGQVSVARLGVQQQKHKNPMLNSEKFVIVSCSSLIKLKRVDRIIDTLMSLSNFSRKKKLVWHHFGDGVLMEELSDYARRLWLGNKVEYHFEGHCKQEDLFNFYERNQVNVFFNYSETEGVPFSIMEALSFGIPVFAPNVGGVGEILDDSSGVLFPSDAQPEFVALKLNLFERLDPVEEEVYRVGAINAWLRNCSAESNYNRLIAEIKSLDA